DLEREGRANRQHTAQFKQAELLIKLELIAAAFGRLDDDVERFGFFVEGAQFNQCSKSSFSASHLSSFVELLGRLRNRPAAHQGGRSSKQQFGLTKPAALLVNACAWATSLRVQAP